MKVLKTIDDWFEKIFTGISTVMLILLVLIVFASVLTRFVFNVSIGNVADTPPYLMIWLVFLGAPFAIKSRSHIRIDIVEMVIKKEKVLTWLYVVLDLIAVALFVLICIESFQYMALTYSYGNQEASLHIPYWILYDCIVFCFVFCAVYYLVNAIKGIMKGVKGCQH